MARTPFIRALVLSLVAFQIVPIGHLETPAGANRASAGGTMTVRPNIPMELNVTGTTLRRAFALVIHDSAQERGIPSDWKPSGVCSQ
jgi:hypothetical protein